MRVLIVSHAGIGHMFPMVPLAWALRAAGNQVLVATAGPALAVREAGLAAVDVKPDWDAEAIMRRLRDSQLPTPGGELRDLRDAIKHLARLSELLVDGVMDVAQRWHPDLIVQLTGQGAGLLAAAKLGVPLCDHGVGLTRSPDMHELMQTHMAATFERYDVSCLPTNRVTIDVAPPSLLAETPLDWPMRYVPYNGGAVLPDWLLDARTTLRRPRIAVCLGTVSPIVDGLAPVDAVIAAASKVDADFVLALGDIDTSALPALPDNVRTVGWMPLGSLLASCDALIHHGGEGTMMAALAYGIPQLVVPTALRAHTARAIADRGVGLTAQPTDITASLLRELLENPEMREAAAQVQTEIADMPPPTDVAPRLLSFAANAHVDR